MFTVPPVEAPVDPDVPELAPVVAEPLPEGIVLEELPEAPIPEVVPELTLGLLLDGDTVAAAVPPADPIPDAVPEAVPAHAARPAAQASAMRVVLIMIDSFESFTRGPYARVRGTPGPPDAQNALAR